MFGSYARNEADEDSDIDILIDTEESSIKGLFDLGALFEDLSDALEKNIDLMTMRSLTEYSNDKDSQIIANNIKKDMVQIYDRIS